MKVRFLPPLQRNLSFTERFFAYYVEESNAGAKPVTVLARRVLRQFLFEIDQKDSFHPCINKSPSLVDGFLVIE